MKKLRNIIIAVCCAGLASCSDFLEPKSDYEFIPETVDALNEILLGDAYLVTIRGNDVDVGSILQLLDDDVECSEWENIGTSYVTQAQDARLIYSWQPDAFEILYTQSTNRLEYNIYKNYYKKILGANAVLDMIDEVEGEEDERRDVRAQAHALRGFYYFNLVNLYGKPYSADKEAPGVPLKLESGLEGTGFPRNTVEECYEQILADLKTAEENYLANPVEMQFRKNYRTSLPMVQLLLARVYLYMEDWENARTYASKVINDWGLRLMDFNNLPEASDPPYINFVSMAINPEVIFAYYINTTGVVGNIKREDANWNSRGVFSASQSLVESFDETPGDLRKDEYLIEEYYFPNQFYHAYSKIPVNWNYTPQYNAEAFDRAFRLAEAYLIQAEASAELFKAGKASVDEALEPLNDLRRTRFTPPYTEITISDPDELIAFIRRERRRELCFEDHRWFDLRRWGMPRIEHKWHEDAQTTLTYVLEEGDPGYTLPIPFEEFQLNDELIQNETVPSRDPIN